MVELSWTFNNHVELGLKFHLDITTIPTLSLLTTLIGFDQIRPPRSPILVVDLTQLREARRGVAQWQAPLF